MFCSNKFGSPISLFYLYPLRGYSLNPRTPIAIQRVLWVVPKISKLPKLLKFPNLCSFSYNSYNSYPPYKKKRAIRHCSLFYPILNLEFCILHFYSYEPALSIDTSRGVRNRQAPRLRRCLVRPAKYTRSSLVT